MCAECTCIAIGMSVVNAVGNQVLWKELRDWLNYSTMLRGSLLMLTITFYFTNILLYKWSPTWL